MTKHTLNTVLRPSTAKAQPRYRGKYPNRYRSLSYSNGRLYLVSNDHYVLDIPGMEAKAAIPEVYDGHRIAELDIRVLAQRVADWRNDMEAGRKAGPVAARVEATIDRFCVGETWCDEQRLIEAEDNFSSVVLTALTSMDTRRRAMASPYTTDGDAYNKARSAAREAAKADARVTTCQIYNLTGHDIYLTRQHPAIKAVRFEPTPVSGKAGPVARFVMNTIKFAQHDLTGDIMDPDLMMLERDHSGGFMTMRRLGETMAVHAAREAQRADERVSLPRGPRGLYSVAVYLTDRAYGGPEEGGWYYTAGEIAPEFGIHLRMFEFENAAYAYSKQLGETVLAEANEGRPAISSVRSRGQYQARVHDGFAPDHFPATRPHYE